MKNLDSGSGIIQKELKLASLDVRGLTEDQKKVELANDLKEKRVDICCFQETKISSGCDTFVENFRVVSLPSDSSHYGNGFAISEKWKNNVYKYWKINDRISALQLETC